MASAVRRRAMEAFQIHEDAPTQAEDTDMLQESELQSEPHQDEEDDEEAEGEGEEEDDAEDRDQDDNASESSDDGDVVDVNVQRDMVNLQNTFPGFRDRYRLVRRIGEGTFSTVYKAEDLQYDHYDNTWDLDEKESVKWTPPPLKRFHARSSQPDSQRSRTRRRPRFVALKKIYVTSSPQRIFNELDLLHDLRACASVCPLITAFRQDDQVVAVLPYFRHSDFRDYFRDMRVADMRIYMRCLFLALRSVHDKHILHRDIKPTNFLYDPASRRGVLVDFGLAEREGADAKRCLCHESREVRKARLNGSTAALAGPQQGYPKSDTRPARRANRAGTRGFRAPEVLFKCTEQTTRIDVWSAGVVLLTILSRRFPFFNSADDVEAMIEIATIFGSRRMKAAGQLHGAMFETNIPTVGRDGFSFEKLILWSTCRDPKTKPLSGEEKLAIEFLGRCLELDPSRRITAYEALEHEFLRDNEEASMEMDDEDDEIDILET